MRQLELGSKALKVPAIAAGCMRLTQLGYHEAESYVKECMGLGVNFFDHADIYADGESERIFGEILKNNPSLRDRMLLQSKCGIVLGKMYDLSKEHIIRSVEDSLKRLHTDYLDMLILHRPDALLEPEEIAEAFDQLVKDGKVRDVGVSNFKPMQIELLKTAVQQELLVNQLQFSIPVSNMIANGLEVNMETDGSVDHDGSILDYCRIHKLTIQAWSPFQKPSWKGVFLEDMEYEPLNQALEEVGAKYHATPTTIATAWILRHPARMQVVAGTTNVNRMKEIVLADEITLTREEWYHIYLAAGHLLP